ncbi:hypothetical protein MD484_g7497, partial [Candolleomyces efflorescens]
MPDTKFEIAHLQNPSDQEIDRIVEVLSGAFAGDPFSSIVVGGYTDRADIVFIQSRQSVAAAAIGGTIHVLKADGEIVGVAIWFGPGQSLNSTEQQRAAGWNEFMRIAPDDLRSWWVDYFIPLMVKSGKEAFGRGRNGEEYPLEAWHLHLFGILPEFQGKGYGKKLVQFAEAEAEKDKNGNVMVVETTTDVDVIIYTKLGFEIKKQIGVESSIGNARLWFMMKHTGDGQ